MLIAILLVPVLIYLILSGKLLQLDAGGVSAKFNNAAQKPLIDKDGINNIPLEIEPVTPDEKMGEGELPALLRKKAEKLQQMDIERRSGSLIVTVRLHSYYDDRALLYYLQGLSRFRNFTYLVIFDEGQEVFAYTSAWCAIQILQLELELKDEQENSYMMQRYREIFGRGFVEAIKEGNTEALSRYALSRVRVRSADKTLDVLKMMTELNMNELIVTDENDRLKGIVQREQVLSRFILAVAQ